MSLFFLCFKTHAQTVTVLNDSTELQEYDTGEKLKVNYLLNGIPISLKDKGNLLAEETYLKQEFNIKTVAGETVGEINFIAANVSLNKDVAIVPVAKTINILNNPKGKAFPLFNWADLNGKLFSNENLKGKIVVLNFWHTSCGPCIAEMPALNELVEKYSGKDVVFIASSLNKPEELKKFFLKRDFKYNQVALIDPTTIFDPMPGWPIHIVIDGNGITRFAVLGKQPAIEQRISKAIEESLTTYKE